MSSSPAPVVSRSALWWTGIGLCLWAVGCFAPSVSLKSWFWGTPTTVSLVSGIAMLLDLRDYTLAVIVLVLGFGAPAIKWWVILREVRGNTVGAWHNWAAKFSSMEILVAAFILVTVKFVTPEGEAVPRIGIYFLMAAWACGMVASYCIHTQDTHDDDAPVRAHPVYSRAAVIYACVGLLAWLIGCAVPSLLLKSWLFSMPTDISLLTGVGLLIADRDIALTLVVVFLGFFAPAIKWWVILQQSRGRAVDTRLAWAARYSSLEIFVAAFILVTAKLTTAGGDVTPKFGIYFLMAAWVCGIAASACVHAQDHTAEVTPTVGFLWLNPKSKRIPLWFQVLLYVFVMGALLAVAAHVVSPAE